MGTDRNARLNSDITPDTTFRLVHTAVFVYQPLRIFSDGINARFLGLIIVKSFTVAKRDMLIIFACERLMD